ncbi:hypothetical protein [Gordonia sp. (in: high G+C Gram-positive bacteria)]|uniref:hypothetical protein n=1 Tax=Gordonia sp. (in: high G+C Gram-positive bacteria) TaxID=84139 RepID=UPI0039E5D676
MSDPQILAPGPYPLQPVGPRDAATALRANRLVPRELIRAVLGLAVAAVIAAIVWAMAAPMPTGVVERRGFAGVPSEQLGKYFDGIGWFALGLMLLGVVAGSAFWWMARTWRGPLGAVVLAATTVVVSGLAIEVALATLRARLPDPAKLDVGQTFLTGPKLWMGAPADGAVGAPGILLVLMPTMALLAYLFQVLLAASPTLGADTPEPIPVDDVA